MELNINTLAHDIKTFLYRFVTTKHFVWTLPNRKHADIHPVRALGW